MTVLLKNYPASAETDTKAHLLHLAGDPTRIRILCLLYDQEEACVTEIADSLGMSLAAVSHHLQQMKDSDMLETERKGQTICYSVQQSDFMKNLKKIIC